MNVFFNSKNILCQIHLVDNIISKIKLYHLEGSQKEILDSVFGCRIGAQRTRALVDLSGDDFSVELHHLLESWKELSEGGIKFADYFYTEKVPLLQKFYTVGHTGI